MIFFIFWKNIHLCFFKTYVDIFSNFQECWKYMILYVQKMMHKRYNDIDVFHLIWYIQIIISVTCLWHHILPTISFQIQFIKWNNFVIYVYFITCLVYFYETSYYLNYKNMYVCVCVCLCLCHDFAWFVNKLVGLVGALGWVKISNNVKCYEWQTTAILKIYQRVDITFSLLLVYHFIKYMCRVIQIICHLFIP